MKIAILHPTRHDGKRLQPGDTVDIDRDAAKALIDAGAAEPADPKAAAKAKADADAAAAAKAKADAAAHAPAPGASDQPAA